MPSSDVELVDKDLWRDLTSFWFLGLCNNFGFIVMLSAAHDIVGQFNHGDTVRSNGVAGKSRQCHYMSTGVILLAAILPSLFAKLLMPFIPFCINIRVAFAVISSVVSFILVAFATAEWMAILGVIFTSAGSGMGEATFIAYSSSFNKNVVSTWSSGTGGAGLLGSLYYAGLIGLGLTPRDTMLIMLIIPIIEAMSFWILLRIPKDMPAKPTIDSTNDEMAEDKALETLKEKILYIQNLVKYFLPLTLVYLFQYFINQGLYELVYFENIFLDKPAQYRWLNVDYQIGLFISRSSVNLVQFPRVWIMTVFQFLNVVYFLTEVIFYYTPSIWLTFALGMWEGLLGGGAYVNTYYRMSKEITPQKRRYALSIVIQSDSFGVALAGVLAVPTHNAICGMPILVRGVIWDKFNYINLIQSV